MTRLSYSRLASSLGVTVAEGSNAVGEDDSLTENGIEISVLPCSCLKYNPALGLAGLIKPVTSKF